jgi:hypothetical protein
MLTMTTSEGQEPELTENQKRTAKARAALRRNFEQRRADELRARGWLCIPPDAVIYQKSGDDHASGIPNTMVVIYKTDLGKE